jgi:enamine deaminase RidA (YjgF/YER057c/UK114 family)
VTHRILHPPMWARAKGYANGVSARGRTIFVSGQIGWDAQQRLVGHDFLSQARQALLNIVEILATDGAKPEHLVRLTWYLTNRGEYVKHSEPLGAIYREIMGRHFPAMSAFEVKSLMEAGALVEIEATAVVPE